MRPIIYVPNKTGCEGKTSREFLSCIGLQEISHGIDCLKVADGPDGAGRLFGWLDSKQYHCKYEPDKQTWVKSVRYGEQQPGAYWVGFWNESMPREAEMRRPDVRIGKLVKLGDDASWMIPTIDTLDRYPDLQEDGSIKWCVDEAYNFVVVDLEKRKAEGVIRPKTTGGDSKSDDLIVSFLYDDDNDFMFFCRLLQINYRVTPEIVSHLRLVTRNSIRGIVSALMGLELHGG